MVRSEVFSWVNLIHKQHIDFMILLDRFYLGTDHLTCKGGGYGFLFRSEICLRTTRELEYLFFFQHADVHATACWRIGSYAPDV